MIACATGCTMRGRHLPDCPDPDTCTGCLPRPSADRSTVCIPCEDRTRRVLAEIPDWYVALAERPRITGIATYGNSSGGSAEACPDCDTGQACDRRHRPTPTQLGHSNITARSTIRAHLVTWCDVLATRHGITRPSEATITATTRAIASYESIQSSAHRLGSSILAQPSWDPSLRRTLPPDPAAARHHKEEEHRHARAAAQARLDRETGRDVIRALAEHVARHLGRLIGDATTAAVVVGDFVDAARDARRHANQGRSMSIRFPCPKCGTQVRLDMDTRNDIACRECGEKGDVNWWIGQQPTMTAEPMTLTQIRDFLLVRHCRDIPLETLRTWSKPRPGADGPLLPEVGRNDRGHKQYDPIVAVALIEQRAVPNMRAG